ncbi:MAG: type II toxin-antitoxin system VapC family toxin [Microgenomates group bacterium]
MKRVVLDTSVVVKWYSEEKDSKLARQLILDLKEEKIEIYLPELVKYELGNALLKGKNLPVKTGQRVLEDFCSLPFNFVKEEGKLAVKNYQIANKLGITYYDACFIGVAKKIGAILISANPRHQGKKYPGLKILSLKEYNEKND